MHGPVKPPLDEGEALAVIRQAGAVPSISQLATMLSWERTSTGRVLARWQAAGLVAVEDGPRGRKIIRALTVVQAEHTCAQPANTQFEPPAPAPAANAVLHDIGAASGLTPCAKLTFAAIGGGGRGGIAVTNRTYRFSSGSSHSP